MNYFFLLMIIWQAVENVILASLPGEAKIAAAARIRP
jgi:hypothetical protein